MSKVKKSIESVRAKIKSLIGTNDSNDLFDTFLTFLPENVSLVRATTPLTQTTTTSTAATMNSASMMNSATVNSSGSNKKETPIQVT